MTRPRGSAVRLLAAAGAAAALVAACTSAPDTGDAAAPDTPAPVGTLPGAAQQIMDKPAYAGARWIYQVADKATGEVLYSSRPDELAFTASTAKLFTIGALLDSRGADSTLTTPVYAVGARTGDTLTGHLDLVASGDLTLGGREAAQGKAVDATTATTVDHVYGDIAPNGARPAGDPLAGLDALAAQVAASGIRHVDGDAVIDTRLWQPYTAQEGPVPPIFVGDNLLDVTVTPAAGGGAATLTTVPATAAFRVDSQVRTVDGHDAALEVDADPHDPRLLHVTGTIGADAGPMNTIYRIPDAAAWARTLFIEALGRAGVTVTAPADGGNNAAALPAPGAYTDTERVAAYTSPPLSALAGMVQRTSYNTGANAFLCLLAVQAGSTDCTDGLDTVHALAAKADVPADRLILVDGQGGDPASVSPADMTRWLRFVDAQPWGTALRDGLPVLGESGTLAPNGLQSPARGTIAAKTGTSAHGDPATGAVLFNVQSLAGYMTAGDGRELVFDVAVSGGVFDDPIGGVTQVGDDVADVAAAFQQAAR
ncbi:D-alanyl-D-alanine carboxypeptidase/D-alanyl-D-alanine-endopeptidase [Tomitella fengzijianii]|uniref:D-alanyl-D-alanine carboxypeptidase/D-alanyl-D-alanine endopeptidase n=1 Tax=Tomitella fengzijianii TaxID=2597660 RepID=UPI00131DD478|nr:D-alanyl-D-alanine carboxypeptidase/D-alanyl-D-alanine-endopeptidase [Tomitella fengzijianii]